MSENTEKWATWTAEERIDENIRLLVGYRAVSLKVRNARTAQERARWREEQKRRGAALAEMMNFRDKFDGPDANGRYGLVNVRKKIDAAMREAGIEGQW